MKPLKQSQTVRRFPRLLRFPRFPKAERRNDVGTLLCICGKAGKHFFPESKLVKIGKLYPDDTKHYQFRAFCSEECQDLYLLNTGRDTYHWRVAKMKRTPGWEDFKIGA